MKKIFYVEAAVANEWTWVHRFFRSLKSATDHVEYVRKIGEHKNLRYRIVQKGGPVVKTYPKFIVSGA